MGIHATPQNTAFCRHYETDTKCGCTLHLLFSIPRSGNVYSSNYVCLQLCVLFSFFAVSIVLFLVSRFSPHEWKSVSISDTQLDHAMSSTSEVRSVYLLQIDENLNETSLNCISNSFR